MRPLVILGSARSAGDTRRAVDIALPGVEIICLPDLHMGGYDYEHRNGGDDFRAAIAAVLRADSIIFATPVYWYAMSAPLKLFFDRLTDLLETMKADGRAMEGKQVWLIAAGVESGLPEGFEVPFARTADYFAMRYRGAGYLYTGTDAALRAASEAALASFGAAVFAG